MPSPASTLIFAVIFLVILAVTLVALVTLAVWQRGRRNKTLALTIANQGNVRDRYNLRAESAADGLSFRFAANGAPLQQVGGTGVAAPPVTALATVTASDAAPMSPSGPPAPPGPSLTGLIAELLSGIGYFLPGSMGQSLTRTASQLRYGQAMASKATQVSTRMAGVAGSTLRTGKELVAVTGSAQGSAAIPPAPGGKAWWQTPSVEPGASLKIGVHLSPGPAASGRSERYQLLSRSAEQDGAESITADGEARLGGGAGIWRWLPYLLILAASLVISLAAFAAVQANFGVR
jgi:hypothetical protein